MDSIYGIVLRHRIVFGTVFSLFLFTMWLSRWKTDEPVADTNRSITKRKANLNRFLEVENVCHDVHVFMMKPEKQQTALKIREKLRRKPERIKTRKNVINETTLIGVMLSLLLISAMIAVADVLKVKREQRSNNNSPDGETNEKCSLAEFANMKRRRKSSVTPGFTIQRAPPLHRFESVGSAFSRLRRESTIVGCAVSIETPNTPPLVPTKAPLKLLGENDVCLGSGARPAPMLRRSSFPAAPFMEGDQRRRLSIDSEEDSSPDTRRRVRIIRRH